ncbi:MAG: hypothetical protein OXC07_10640 [Kistimonas sp.]|nr:hypothetical protein [Kistimonas sp.]
MDQQQITPGRVMVAGSPVPPGGTTSSPTQYAGRSVQQLSANDENTAATVTSCFPSLPEPGTAPAALLPDDAPLPFASFVDFKNSQLPVNYRSDDFVPLEKRIAPPAFMEELQEKLDKDPWWSEKSWKPGTLDEIKTLLQERQAVEARGDEFEFKPLLTTLKNMKIFIEHIQTGKQFDGELTPEEKDALTRLAQATEQLVTAERAPYKRTVCLALSLVILCEIVTRRQVLRADVLASPALKSLAATAFLGNEISDRVHLLAALPLNEAADGRSQKGRPARPDKLLEDTLRQALRHRIHDPQVLLYPSFHPMTVADFCRFGHLPVYPVGLTTSYVQAADGALMSPLEFAHHDLSHSYDLTSGRNASGSLPRMSAEAAFCSSEKLLCLRRMLLDELPVQLSGHISLRARELLFFQLIHEQSPGQSAHIISTSPSPFVSCLRTLEPPRRGDQLAYEPAYRNITDTEAAMAALWTVRLWEHWQAADFQPLPPDQLEACARQFLATDLPQLEQHLRFCEDHRGALRWLFVATAEDHRLGQNNHHVCTTTYDPQDEDTDLVLFLSYDPTSGLCNRDHTNLAYFTTLRFPEYRQRMTSATGCPVPDASLFIPATPAEPQAMET